MKSSWRFVWSSSPHPTHGQTDARPAPCHARAARLGVAGEKYYICMKKYCCTARRLRVAKDTFFIFSPFLPAKGDPTQVQPLAARCHMSLGLGADTLSKETKNNLFLIRESFPFAPFRRKVVTAEHRGFLSSIKLRATQYSEFMKMTCSVASQMIRRFQQILTPLNVPFRSIISLK